MSRIPLYGAVAVVVVAGLAGGGYLFARHQMEADTVRALEGMRQSVAPGIAMTWGPIDVAVFGKTVGIDQLTFKAADNGGVPAIAFARADFRQGAKPSSISFVARDINALTPGSDGPVTMTAASITGTDITHVNPNILASSLTGSASAALRGLNAGEVVLSELFTTDRARNETVSMRALSMRDVTSGVAASMTADGLRIVQGPPTAANPTAEQGTIEVERLSARTLALGGWEESIESPAMMAQAQNLFGLDALTLSNMKVALIGKPELTIGGLGIDGIGRDQGVVTSLRVYAQKIDMPMAALDDMDGGPEADAFRQALASRGINRLTLSAEYVQTWDPAARTLAIAPLTLDIQRLGRVDMGMKVGGMDFPRMIRSQANSLEAMAMGVAPQPPMADILAMQIHDARLAYTDGDLADILIDLAAGGDREGMAASLAQMAFDGLGDEVEPRAKAQAVAAVDAFIRGAGGFEIAVNPRRPVSVPDLDEAQASGRLSDLLNLTIKGY